MTMTWKPIATAPNHGRQVLVGFMGQHEWYSYVTNAQGLDTAKHSGFALPTHWTEIIPPTA